MKKKLLILTTILSTALLFSSCLKDNSHYVDFSKGGTFVDFPLGGFVNFSSEAITESANANGIVVRQFAVNVASANLPTAPTTVTLGAGDATDVATINKLQSNVVYELMPTNAYTIVLTKVTIPAGKQNAVDSVIFDKTKLDPAKSYVLPLKIVDAGGQKISGNLNVLYYHFIGNDFAGVDVWDYRRWQNGTGPGTNPDGSPAIPSQGEGLPPNITGLGQVGHIQPVTSNVFQIETGYNGTGVLETVSFTRTVDGAGVIHYTNWKVTIDADNIAKWTNAGIINLVPPTFTIPPPATSADPKIIETNYISEGAAVGSSPRYIDDTYHP